MIVILRCKGKVALSLFHALTYVKKKKLGNCHVLRNVFKLWGQLDPNHEVTRVYVNLGICVSNTVQIYFFSISNAYVA